MMVETPMSIFFLILLAVGGLFGLLLLAGAIVMIAFDKTRPFGLGLLLFLLCLPIVGGLFFYSRIGVVETERARRVEAIAREQLEFAEKVRRHRDAAHAESGEHLIELHEEEMGRLEQSKTEVVQEAVEEVSEKPEEKKASDSAGEQVAEVAEAGEETAEAGEAGEEVAEAVEEVSEKPNPKNTSENAGEADEAVAAVAEAGEQAAEAEEAGEETVEATENDDLQEITNLVTGETRDQLPDWTRYDEAARPGPHGTTRYTLKIGPMEDGRECWEETPEAVEKLLQRHAAGKMGYSPGLVHHLDLPWEHLARKTTEGDLWLEPFETSFGDWVLLHARVTVDDEIEGMIAEQMVLQKQWEGLKQLLIIAGVLILFLFLLWLTLGALVKRRQPSKEAEVAPQKA
jgi:hypothetical protein